MSQSSSSSENSSYAEIVKTVKTVKTVKIEKFSPVKANNSRILISSTPAFKRKRCQIESFSPIVSPTQVEAVKEEVIAAQRLRLTVRRRKNISLNKCRRHVSAISGPKFSTKSIQTEQEENSLIAKYIDEVAKLKFAQSQTAALLQLEKEKCSSLRSTVSNVLERAEIAIDDSSSQNLVLNESIAATKNSDLSNPAGVEAYHEEIKRAIKTKHNIHNGLLGSLKSIKKDCYSSFTELKRQTKCSGKFDSKSNVNKSSSKRVSVHDNNLKDCGILSKRASVSEIVPLNPNVMFLRAPNNKSVKFRVPLEEFLAQNQSEPTNILINVSHEKIEIDIPQSVSPHKIRISQGVSNYNKIPEDLNLSLLNISQDSSSANRLKDEWDRFASTKHTIDDDDVGSLLDYDSSSPAEVVVKREFTKADIVRFTDTDDQTDSE